MKTCEKCACPNEENASECRYCANPFEQNLQNLQNQSNETYRGPIKNDGFAVASLVLGIIGVIPCCYCILNILSLIFGFVALSNIKKSNGKLAGTGMAKAGIILSIIGIIFMGIYLYWYYALGGGAEYQKMIQDLMSGNR